MNPTAKPKGEGVFTTNQTESDSSEDDQATYTTSIDNNTVWSTPALNFPCPLDSHVCEMAECKEWLSMKPTLRWDKTWNRRICFTCLKPKFICKTGNCSSQSNVPAELVRQACVKIVKQKGWSPLHILSCKKRTHIESRYDYPQLKKVLDK